MTMATPQSERVRVHRLDARAALRALPPGSISVLITDPPYRTVDRSRSSGHLRRWFAKSLTWTEIGKILALARSRMRPDGIAFVMTNSDGLGEAITALRRAGFARVRTITWDKQIPGLGGGLRHQTEFILVGYLPGSRTLSGVDLISVQAVGPGTANRYVTEKPEGLGRALARIANVGPTDLVVDPFCGSGGLLVGAAERGATVAGCDVAPAAIKRATSRLLGRDVARKPGSPRLNNRGASSPGARRRQETRGSGSPARASSPPARSSIARPSRPGSPLSAAKRGSGRPAQGS